jgi:hypothetical protein
LGVASQGCLTVAVKYGLGMHNQDLTFDEIVNTIKWMQMYIAPSILSSIVARISICLLLIRIFGSKVWLKWYLIVATFLQAALNIAVVILAWVRATPVEALWNPTIPHTEIDPGPLTFIAGAFFAFGDLTYVLCPVIAIWKLNMPVRRKLGLGILLALSIFTMAAAIVKAVMAGPSFDDKNDKIYLAGLSLTWSVIEQSLVIILGCIPPMKSLTMSQLGPLPRIITSLENLVRGSSKGTSTGASVEGSTEHSEGRYYELTPSGKTVSRIETGTTDDQWQSNGKGNSNSNSNTNSMEAGRIRRTDGYLVTSDDRTTRD